MVKKSKSGGRLSSFEKEKALDHTKRVERQELSEPNLQEAIHGIFSFLLNKKSPQA